MFGIGLPELMIIAVVALIFIGPKNLPGVLRSLGRGLVQVKRATNEVRETVQEEMNQIEREIDLKDVKESTTGLKQDFDGVKNSMDPLKLNRMSTGEQLQAVRLLSCFPNATVSSRSLGISVLECLSA